MRPHVTGSGRPRSGHEQLFTDALAEELDRERKRRELDQRGLAELLGVHESLLSMYRNGQRMPSVPGFIQFEQHFPGFAVRVWNNYYRRVRGRDLATSDMTETEESEQPGPPAERVGSYSLAALLR